nr:hypothetical protein [Tanacetum cinerariifolium]
MSADSAVTYTSVHSEARSWSIPSEDPYEEAAQQLFEQEPHSLEYVPRDHVPVFVPEFEHPEDLVPAEVTQIEALQRDVSTLQRQHINDEDKLTMHIQHEQAQRDVAPEDGDSYS